MCTTCGCGPGEVRIGDEHAHPCSPRTKRARFAVLCRVIEFLGRGDARKFEHDHAMRLPFAFEHRRRATADQIASSVARNGGGRERTVAFVLDGVGDLAVD